MTTIVDVARKAGVSTATVSHVINDTRPVRPSTRERVRSAIAETGYTQDGIARALRRARTETVGLVVTDTGQTVFAEMVRGVEHEARRAGMVVLLSNSADDPERELSSVTALRERRVDGVLLTRVAGSHDELMEQLKASHIPLVLLDRLEASPVVDQVGVETVGPMKSLVEHLIEVGHRRIAIVAGDLEVHTIRERFDGFQMAVRGAGLELPPEWILSGLDQQGQARTRVAEFLGGRNGVTALVSASNVLTAGTLLALRDAGLRIPEDLAVVTFDEFPYAELFAPRLTSVVQPAFKIGQEAMRLLIKRIAKPNAEPRTIRLQPTLSHGASCGCALGTPIVWGPEARALMPEHRSELVP